MLRVGDDAHRIRSRTPEPGRLKRLRSVTPSENGSIAGEDGQLRSPLSKRKKVIADRTGTSRLKDSIVAAQLPTMSIKTLLHRLARRPRLRARLEVAKMARLWMMTFS
jgi:hypothetical protein